MPTPTPDPDTPYRIGVLSLHNSKETKAILNAIDDLGHQPVWLDETTMRTWMDRGTIHVEPEIDIVLNRLLLTKTARPVEDLGVAVVLDTICPVLNPPDAVLRAINKFAAGATLTSHGTPVPPSIWALGGAKLNDGETPIAGRAVHKTLVGTNGGRMALIDTDQPTSPWLGGRRAFLQEFIDSDTDRPSDVRVYVVGDRVVGAMRRHAPAGEWRTNVAVGGDVEDVTGDLSSDATEQAREATNALGLDYAGVDLISRDGRWFVLEVNTTAGFRGFFDATGVSPAPYIARLAIERAGGHVDERDVEAIATTLDDSIPSCRPGPVEEPVERATLGYTERVEVAGSHGLESVVAKLDTGAKRTSIDVTLAADIGVGPITGTTRVKSGVHQSVQTRPLVELDIAVNGDWTTVTASIEDRNHMTHSALIGRDALSGYQIDVDRQVIAE